ncbi:MAG: MBL fold metallo-hydrolase [Rhodospirillaceae bacterium]
MTPRAEPITDEIWQVGGRGLTAPDDAAVYLIDFGGRAALVDSGCGRSLDRLLSNVGEAGVTPERIECLLLTHCHFDHTGGAAGLRGLLGGTVIAHALDAPFIEQGDSEVSAATWYGARMPPCRVDRRLAGAETRLTLGGRIITALHVPGHSPGSQVFVVESAGRTVLFGQDVHGPLHPALLSDPGDYQRSLQRLLAVGADILCEGHYGVIRGRAEVERFITSFQT